MSREVLRIATRSSPLAIWQAEYVQQRLESLHEGLSVELVRIKTQGDKILDTPLAKIGGKGLFVKELEEAIMDGRADIAVHSMKDVPMELPEGFALPMPSSPIITTACRRCPRGPASARPACAVRPRCRPIVRIWW